MANQHYGFGSESLNTIFVSSWIGFNFEARKQNAAAKSHGNPAPCKAQAWTAWAPRQVWPGLAFFASIHGLTASNKALGPNLNLPWPGLAFSTSFHGLASQRNGWAPGQIWPGLASHFFPWPGRIKQQPGTSSQQKWKKTGFLNLYTYSIKLLSARRGRPPFVLDVCIVQCSM